MFRQNTKLGTSLWRTTSGPILLLLAVRLSLATRMSGHNLTYDLIKQIRIKMILLSNTSVNGRTQTNRTEFDKGFKEQFDLFKCLHEPKTTKVKIGSI
jgi:hypothetical protein